MRTDIEPIGLLIIRTSVDHGTAFDSAGTGKAKPASLVNAIKFARVMAKNRVHTQPWRSS